MSDARTFDLRPLKVAAARLDPSHPFCILLQREPDLLTGPDAERSLMTLFSVASTLPTRQT